MLPTMPARRANAADIDAVATIIAQAFATDPVWSLALARPDGSTGHEFAHWRRYVEAAVPQGFVWVMAGLEAASVWIPPGGHELPPGEEASLGPWLDELLGSDGRDAYLDLAASFEAAHPASPPHYYLTLLATNPDHRGHGFGMGLLAENLAAIDAESMPAYLESTNPANDRRYEAVGFRRMGEFETHGGAAPVTTMWRERR
jgi:GNAT superfamily N-acetyltransferase